MAEHTTDRLVPIDGGRCFVCGQEAEVNKAQPHPARFVVCSGANTNTASSNDCGAEMPVPDMPRSFSTTVRPSSHEKLLLRTRRRGAFVCGLGAVALMSGCIQTHSVRATNSAAVPHAASSISRSEAPELGVARAAGVRVRPEWGPYVVFPTFLAHVSEMDPAAEPPLSIWETEASRRVLLDAFRAGGHAQMVDTLVYKDHRRLAALPDSPPTTSVSLPSQ